MGDMAELIYYCGTMDSGKSTLALQTAHNHKSRGRTGLIFTSRAVPVADLSHLALDCRVQLLKWNQI